jgi:hypothetical protein
VGTSYSFLVGPLVACGALLVIVLMCRWVFSTSDRDQRAARRAALAAASRGGDYGLLVPVAAVRTADDAEMLRAVLADAGIRCTVTPTRSGAADGAVEVLVFRADAVRAKDLVSS